MIKFKQNLMISQMDQKFSGWNDLKTLEIPSKSWIFSIRNALKMTLRQLGEKLEITPQSVKELEEREKSGSITLKSLREAANALDCRLVYVLLPQKESLREMIEQRALELAEEIVMRTSQTMTLENQKVSEERLRKAIEEKAEEIQREMPSYLWD